MAITSTDGNATLPASAALSSGTRTFSVTLNTAGTATLTAGDSTDGTKTASTSPSITVNPKVVTISSGLTVNGKEYDGTTSATLSSSGSMAYAARRLGLAEAVRFPGVVSEEEKLRLLRTSWANLFPSPKEGCGITVVEAAACGTPSIASDSPALRDSVRAGITGYEIRQVNGRGAESYLGYVAFASAAMRT